MISKRNPFSLLTALCCVTLLTVHTAGAQETAKPDAPTATGKVTAYEADKSITIEIANRNGAKKMEFAIVKDKTKIELPPRVKEIKIDMVLSVWADKENPTVAARIGRGSGPPAAPSTRRPNNRPAAEAAAANGQVAAYEAEKSITVEIKQRGGQTSKTEFAVDKEKTKIEFKGDAKAIAAGMPVSVWADKENAKLAVRIVAGTDNTPQPRRPNNRPAAEAAAAVGQVSAYEAEKSITVEIKQRGGQTSKAEFTIDREKTKIELAGDAKAIAVGMPVSVWAGKDNPKLAARIVAGTQAAPQPRPRRPNNTPPNPNLPRTSSVPPPAEAPVPPPVPKPIRQPVAGLAPADVARQIDAQIQARLEAEKIPASPICDDAEFIRRLYLDITGVIPPPEKVVAFLDSHDPDKRAKLIDELMASPEYGLHFADLWCDRIAVKDTPIYREPFIAWMSESLNLGLGWDEMVLEMLTAEGKFGLLTRGSRLRPDDPRGLLMVLNTEAGAPPKPNPALLAAESGRLFLGVQLQCAECHDHPFSGAWKQTDFWGLAAFFGQFRAGSANPGFRWEETPAAADKPVSIVIPPTSLKNIGKVVPARLLGQEADYRPGDQQLLRHSLARWLTAADNPFFAQATANRLWGDFFGRGLVNPVNDLRPDNPPSHPEVLQLLAEEVKKSQFDLKHVVRCICLTQTYQRTSAPLAANEVDEDKFSHMAVKVMGPGVFYDCLTKASGFPELKVGLPERKTKLTVATTFTPREVFVDFFRSSQGEEADPLENAHGIPQALKLMNASQLNGVAPIVQRLAGSGLSQQQAIEQLYLTTLARRPTAEEARLMADFLARRKDALPEQGYSAVLWTLINSAEFVSNH